MSCVKHKNFSGLTASKTRFICVFRAKFCAAGVREGDFDLVETKPASGRSGDHQSAPGEDSRAACQVPLEQCLAGVIPRCGSSGACFALVEMKPVSSDHSGLQTPQDEDFQTQCWTPLRAGGCLAGRSDDWESASRVLIVCVSSDLQGPRTLQRCQHCLNPRY